MYTDPCDCWHHPNLQSNQLEHNMKQHRKHSPAWHCNCHRHALNTDIVQPDTGWPSDQDQVLGSHTVWHVTNLEVLCHYSLSRGLNVSLKVLKLYFGKESMRIAGNWSVSWMHICHLVCSLLQLYTTWWMASQQWRIAIALYAFWNWMGVNEPQ